MSKQNLIESMYLDPMFDDEVPIGCAERLSEDGRDSTRSIRNALAPCPTDEYVWYRLKRVLANKALLRTKRAWRSRELVKFLLSDGCASRCHVTITHAWQVLSDHRGREIELTENGWMWTV